MIENKKVRNYLLYAIGEIFLVIIGILLALQINNLKEEQAESQLEFEILAELYQNLQFDLEELRSDYSGWEFCNTSCRFMLDYLDTKSFPNEQFFKEASLLRVAAHFDPNKSGYTLLTSKGVELIENDSLRKSISVLYETKYPYFNKYEKERVQFRLLYVTPIVQKYFTRIVIPQSAYLGEYWISPQDYQQLRNDDSFYKILNAIIYENDLMQKISKNLENYILELLEQLKVEMKVKNK
jgi:hypothetical protein